MVLQHSLPGGGRWPETRNTCIHSSIPLQLTVMYRFCRQRFIQRSAVTILCLNFRFIKALADFLRQPLRFHPKDIPRLFSRLLVNSFNNSFRKSFKHLQEILLNIFKRFFYVSDHPEYPLFFIFPLILKAESKLVTLFFFWVSVRISGSLSKRKVSMFFLGDCWNLFKYSTIIFL
jgi:hypothetical protein